MNEAVIKAVYCYNNMDTLQIPTDEEEVKASLIHKDGHWTDPPTSTDTEAGTQEFTVRCM